jgi:hypothetical protein
MWGGLLPGLQRSGIVKGGAAPECGSASSSAPRQRASTVSPHEA